MFYVKSITRQLKYPDACSIILSLFLLLFTIASYADELGVLGQTYPIVEQDFLEFIQQKLKKLEASGQLTIMQKKLVKETQKHVDRPKSVYKPRATQNRSWLFDPTITVKNDIVVNGKIVIKAGTKTNPLDLINITKTLIFYDADDKEQVMWVKKIDKKLQSKTKLVLVNGSVFSQVRLFQKAVYFDQGGKLTAHFNIRYVPAMVSETNILDENRFSGIPLDRPEQFGNSARRQGERGGSVFNIHDRSDRRCQQSGKPKCEGYKRLKISEIKI